MIGLYLHLPFCLSKCHYCDFDSQPLERAGGLPFARRYLRALAVEMDLRAATQEFAGAEVDTVYLGGGTPTVLPADGIAALLDRIRTRFRLRKDAEITIEANPRTVHLREAAALLEAGVNRVSLGVQAFSDPLLRVLGRAHSADEAREAAALLRKAGCSNLGLDLIYGVPGQSLDDWDATLHQALELRPEHISIYALSLEPGTPLEEEVAAGRLPEPEEELVADMYHLAAERLCRSGYRHYELSNFALPGRECRHNRRYWAGGEYLGLGCSAHSHRSGIRWHNLRGAQGYVHAVDRGLLPVARAERLSAARRVGEMLMLGLRREEGVGEQEVAAACGLAPRAVYGQEIAQLCEQGLLIAEQDRLRLPRERWLVANEVLSRLVGEPGA